MRIGLTAFRWGTVGLLLACALLMLILVKELEAGRTAAGSAEQGVAAIEAELPAWTEQTFELPPLEHYAEVVERPLLSQTRRPYQPEVVTLEAEPETPPQIETTPPPAPEWTLVGVVITPQTRSVMLKDKAGNRFMRLAQDMDLDGWKVKDVSTDQVILSQGGKQHTLELRNYDLHSSENVPVKRSDQASKTDPAQRGKLN